MTDRQREAQGCLFLLVLFGIIRTAICQSVSQSVKKKKKKNFTQTDFRAALLNKFFTGNEDMWRERRPTALVGVKGQS